MSTAAQTHYTLAEYLAFERASETKHEFYDGEIFRMAGASEPHNLVVGNTIGALNQALRDTPCRVYPSDTRVRCPSGLRTYPDVSVVCDEPQFEDDQRDTLLNPRVIIEVLSPSTEKYDRVTKFGHYRGIDSLQEYVLVSQDRQYIEHFARQPEGEQWLWTACNEPAAVLRFPALRCEIPLEEFYVKVPLAPEPGLHDEPSAGPR